VAKNAEVSPHCGSRIHLSWTDSLAALLFVLALIDVLIEFFGFAARR
jgi:hypothetical protein